MYNAAVREIIKDPSKEIYKCFPYVVRAPKICNKLHARTVMRNDHLLAYEVRSAAWARLKLYQEMDKLDENALYHDKDGIIYASDGKNDLPPDISLEVFTNELEGDENTTITGKTLYFPP
ncbi:hypothetical protein CEXT_366501 [Caerostris extrusa]|uniref:Uncharacterized protein n=1 Tax=Caerostris extrusa TaxID=172846 RepID=A0AAV4PYK9_CAEEX|nr:hypothetical protein CEXT_366501 [Caerostris extrusa]